MSPTHPSHHDPTWPGPATPVVAQDFATALLDEDRASLLRLLAPRVRLHHHRRTIVGTATSGRAPVVAEALLDPLFWGGELQELLWLAQAGGADRNSARFRALVREEPGRHQGDLHVFFDPVVGQVHAVHHVAVPLLARRGPAGRGVVQPSPTSSAGRLGRPRRSGGDRAGQRREVP